MHNGIPVNNQNFETLWLDKYIYNSTWKRTIYETAVNGECQRKLHNWKEAEKDEFYDNWLMGLQNFFRFHPLIMLSKGQVRRRLEVRTVFSIFFLLHCEKRFINEIECGRTKKKNKTVEKLSSLPLYHKNVENNWNLSRTKKMGVK